MAVLEARELYRFYHAGDEEVIALRGVSVTVDRGETVAIVGPSGSGKSTLLACAAGLDEPDGGTVDILGHRLTRRTEGERAALRASRIGVLLQAGNLVDGLTVEENLRFQLSLIRQRDERRIAELLERVGLASRRHAVPGQLSGGEAARAAFAAAFANDPPLLVADEPTGEVDAESESALLAMLDERRRNGGATLVVTHSDALASHADRILHLQDGRLVDV